MTSRAVPERDRRNGKSENDQDEQNFSHDREHGASSYWKVKRSIVSFIGHRRALSTNSKRLLCLERLVRNHAPKRSRTLAGSDSDSV